METYLRCFVNACPSKWLQWLPLAEYWYNNCTPSATHLTPFAALYGYEPKHFGISAANVVESPNLLTWVQEREVITDLRQQHLHRAKICMKKQADQHRSERQIAVGDQVFVNLQPYV
jgi:hypothetical protein